MKNWCILIISFCLSVYIHHFLSLEIQATVINLLEWFLSHIQIDDIQTGIHDNFELKKQYYFVFLIKEKGKMSSR